MNKFYAVGVTLLVLSACGSSKTSSPPPSKGSPLTDASGNTVPFLSTGDTLADQLALTIYDEAKAYCKAGGTHAGITAYVDQQIAAGTMLQILRPGALQIFEHTC